ncbi:hypothetical protein GVX82_00445 [Patescibacteria group bacterium]|nr:hypothetical protein [Patescibacteria group bacterium]
MVVVGYEYYEVVTRLEALAGPDVAVRYDLVRKDVFLSPVNWLAGVVPGLSLATFIVYVAEYYQRWKQAPQVSRRRP